LVNALVGSKVTIVSRKVQTTRALIRGIVIEDNAQIILVDTPGIFSPKRRLDRAMVSTAWSGAHDADLVCVLLDAKTGIDEEAEAIFAKAASVNHEKILVLNKIDLVAREKLLALAKAANDRLTFARTFMISAISGDGVDDIRSTLAEMVPPGPFLYPEDQMSDAPMRHLAAEITREKIYRKLHQELPYQSTVETDKWEERKDKSVRIEQTIFVERESQRKIVLGAGGATIKSIGADSRKEVGEILGVAVQMIVTATSLAGGMILLLVDFVWLAADWRKNGPRCVRAAALVLSVISLGQNIGEKGMELDSPIEIVSCVLTPMGLYFSFSGDA